MSSPGCPVWQGFCLGEADKAEEGGGCITQQGTHLLLPPPWDGAQPRIALRLTERDLQRLRSASEQKETGAEELRGLGPAPPRRLGAARRRRCRFGSSGPGCAARHHRDGAARGTSSHLTLPQVALAASPAGEQSPSPAGSPSGNSLGCEQRGAAAHGGTGARGRLAGTGRAAGPWRCQVLPAAPPASTWQVPVPICGAHDSPASAAARCQPRQMLPAASAGGAATWPWCLTGICSPAPPARLSHLQGCLDASRF